MPFKTPNAILILKTITDITTLSMSLLCTDVNIDMGQTNISKRTKNAIQSFFFYSINNIGLVREIYYLFVLYLMLLSIKI